MFVRLSTHQRVVAENRALQALVNQKIDEWNTLVRLINAKGGQRFLDEAQLDASALLSKDDIRRLLQLCHPDKHDGKKIAVEMTQKLLSLKE